MAELLDAVGVEVEVLDLRSLLPLDKEAILKSIEKTSRALVVHEDKVFGGLGGELAAIIAEEGFQLLDAPVRRVGAEFTPIGFNKILESAALPNTDKILKAAREQVAF